MEDDTRENQGSEDSEVKTEIQGEDVQVEQDAGRAEVETQAPERDPLERDPSEHATKTDTEIKLGFYKGTLFVFGVVAGLFVWLWGAGLVGGLIGYFSIRHDEKWGPASASLLYGMGVGASIPIILLLLLFAACAANPI